MPVNADKPHLWKADVARSIEHYNDWFIHYAPRAYQDTRTKTAERVEAALGAVAHLTTITAEALRQDPAILSILRMTATPPIARDRLAGLAQVSPTLLTCMERDGLIPPQLIESVVDADLQKVGAVLMRLADRDIFPWLETGYHLTGAQIHRAAMIIADRLCVTAADSTVRDAQKQRQLAAIKYWLGQRGYAHVETTRRLGVGQMSPGTFAFELNLPVLAMGRATQGMVPIDVAVMPAQAAPRDLPVLIEALSSGDVTHANKRRVEHATTIAELRSTYGGSVRLVLFLCGYVDSAYLGCAAAEGIDWVWEHRIDDLAQLDLVTPVPDEEPAPMRPPLLVSVASSVNRRW